MSATVIYVSFNTPSIDLSWIPADGVAVVVHNDDSLAPETCDHPKVIHVRPGHNVGFGAGVNLGLERATTERVILCNPDTVMRPEHYRALATGKPAEIITVPMVDDHGRPAGMVSPYWTPLTLLGAAHRVGRIAPLGSKRRTLLVPMVSRWGRDQQASRIDSETAWPLSSRWVSGALFSVDRKRLESVGGFDETFFLYYEDADVCRRLQSAFPDMVIRQVDGPPARHSVGGSASSSTTRSAVAGIRRHSATIYAQRQRGRGWPTVARWLSATESPDALKARQNHGLPT